MPNMVSRGLFLLLLSSPGTLGRATISTNGYQDLLVAISPEVEEDTLLVPRLQELITSASAELYGATRQRAYFKSVTILVPQWWNLAAESATAETLELADVRVAPTNPVYGDNPYTVQNGECGEPGDFTHLTPWFVNEHAGNASQRFGRTDKILVHEWAKLRWGVYEEYGYPGDAKFPMFYYQTTWGPTGQEDVLKPNFCTSTEVSGKARDVVTGGECSVLADSGLPDSRCYFYPDKDSKVASSYMALPFLDSVTDFCDETEERLHHAELPTKHNLYCEGRSTWDVIKESPDFLDGANPPNPDITDTTPTFRVVQAKSPQYVVLMDISSSMDTGPDPIHKPELTGVRSENLRNAVKRWLTYEVTDGTEVALVVFSNVAATFDPVVFHMAEVNDESRAAMVEAIDGIKFLGTTCIGCGLDRALNWEGGLQGNGGVILLITDGQQRCETQNGCLTINDMTPEVVARQTRVVTIAFGLDADPALEELAAKSGGKSYFIDDYSGPGNINDAFTGSLTYQPGDVLGDQTTVVHQQDHQGVTSGTRIKGFFDIDLTIGREVTFQLEVQTAGAGEDCSSSLDITLLRPDEAHTPELDHQHFTCTSSNLKVFSHNMAELAEEGRWVYSITPKEDLASISVKVESKSREPSTDPVMTRCWISTGGQQIDTTTDVKLAVVAEVVQGSRPVVGAKVVAMVERPMDSSGDPQPPIELQLLDNGGGADKIKNDGSYARYFAKYTGKGRYSVKCQVSGDDGTNVNGGFTGSRVYPAQPDPSTPVCCGSDAMPPGSQTTPTGNFTRQAAGGAFQVTNDVDPSIDRTPPGRVTDLQAALLPSTILLQFTAPGNDLDSADPAAQYVLKFSSTAGNLTNDNFDNTEFNTQIVDADLVDSTLEPEEGGNTKTIKIQSSTFNTNEKYVIAMKAVDEAGNQSPVSNRVQIYIASSSPTTTTTIPETTTTTNQHGTPCNNHKCTEDGLFPEGPCEDTFCQCEMGLGYLQTCQDGLFFDVSQCVCNWPWNIAACNNQATNAGQLEPRCTK